MTTQYEELEKQYKELTDHYNEIGQNRKGVFKEAQNVLIVQFEAKHGLRKGCRIKKGNKEYFYESVDRNDLEPFRKYNSDTPNLIVRKIKKNGQPYKETTTLYFFCGGSFEVIKDD